VGFPATYLPRWLVPSIRQVLIRAVTKDCARRVMAGLRGAGTPLRPALPLTSWNVTDPPDHVFGDLTRRRPD
jgi:hypothetical protein